MLNQVRTFVLFAMLATSNKSSHQKYMFNRYSKSDAANTNQNKKLAALACAVFAVLALLANDVSAGPSDIGENTAVTSPDEKPESMFEDFELKASVDFATRKVTYGLVDNRDPVFTLGTAVAWKDFEFGVATVFDTTRWGERHGDYGNRSWRHQEITFRPGYSRSFDSFLSTQLEIDLGYTYEHHPSVPPGRGYENPPTQRIDASVGLPEIFLSPELTAEIDIMKTPGALYLHIEGEFPLKLSESFALEFAIGLGIGDPKRNRFDADVNRWSIKDLGVSFAVLWTPVQWLTISPYAEVYEQLDPALREAARHRVEGETHGSTQLICGLNVVATY